MKEDGVKKIMVLVNYLNYLRDQKKLIINKNKNIETKVDEEMFFHSGKLLAILLILKEVNFSRHNIKYRNKMFFIQKAEYNKNLLNKKIVTSKNIIEDIIKNSVYNIEFLPYEIRNINFKNVYEIKRGFICEYKILIKNKIKLTQLLEKEKNYDYVIEALKLLNPKDLNFQSRLIELRFGINFNRCRQISKIREEIVNKNIFTDFCKRYIDKYINYGIIGIGKYGMELMWIAYYNKKLGPLNYRNIYMSLLLAYLGDKECNKYYLQSANYAINSVLSYADEYKSELKKYIDVLELLNKYLKNKNLNLYIRSNLKRKVAENEYIIDYNKKILKSINNSLEVLEKIVL